MTTATELPGAGPGPRLLPEYFNTERGDFEVEVLLDELDMRNQTERNHFLHFVKDYLIYDPQIDDGFSENEIAELDDEQLARCAEQFMDEARFMQQKWPAGQTYFPSAHLQSDPDVSRHRKRWSFIEHRKGLIDVVAQIMIAHRNDLKRKMIATRVSIRSSPLTADMAVQNHGSDADYAPSSPPTLKRSRKQTTPRTSKRTRKSSAKASQSTPSATVAKEHPTDLQGDLETSTVDKIPSPAPTATDRSGSSRITDEVSRNKYSANHGGQQQSGCAIPEARLAGPESIDASKEPTVEGLLLDAAVNNNAQEQSEKLELEKVQHFGKGFEKGLQYAREQLSIICVKLQFAAEEAEGLEAQRMTQEAQALYSAARIFHRKLVKEKDGLSKLVKTLDME